MADRRFSDLHDKSKPDEAGYLPTDGTMVWVATDDLTPEDDFLADNLPNTPAAD